MRRIGLAGLALVSFVIAACGGGDSNTGPAPSIQIAASPSALSVTQGTSGTVQLTLTRTGTISGEVAVSATGLPTGVTAAVTPASLSASTSSATVTVTAAASATPGTYTVNVAASASGVGAASSTFQLTIVAAPAFTLALTPTTASINAGSSGTANIALTRTNLPGAITLSLDNPPAGITGAFAPSAPTVDASVLTVNVASSVAPGNYTLTVKGTATGATDKTATLTLTVGAVPNFTITAAPTTLSVVQGASGTSTLTLARTNFTGEVALSLASPPTGITASFAPAATTANSSVMTVNVAASVAPGAYTPTVQGVGTGPGTRTTTIALTVTAAPNFALSLTPATLSVVAGASGSSAVALTRTNFTSDVALSLVSPPTGITASFAPATTAANSSALTINVASSVTAGSYTLTVQGAGTGVGNRTATLALTVTAPVPVVVNYDLCEPFVTPVWVGFRDGNGAWTRVNPTTVSGFTRYTFTITSNTAAVAYTLQQAQAAIRQTVTEYIQSSSSPFPNRTTTARSASMSQIPSYLLADPSYITRQVHFTKGEAATLAVCTPVPANGTLNATISGLVSGETARIASLGASSAQFTSATSTRALTYIPTGQNDLWTVRQSGGGSNISSDIRRGVTVPGSLTIDATTMVAATTANITITGLYPSQTITDAMYLTTPRGRSGPMPVNRSPSNSVRKLISNASSIPTDMYSYEAGGIALIDNDYQNFRGTYYFGPAVSNLTVAIQPPVPDFTVTTVSNTPVFRVRVAGRIPAAYNGNVLALLNGTYNGQSNSFELLATNAWLTAQGSNTAYSLTMEDLSAGMWPATAALNGPVVTSTVTLMGSNYSSQPVAGSYFVSTERTKEFDSR